MQTTIAPAALSVINCYINKAVLVTRVSSIYLIKIQKGT